MAIPTYHDSTSGAFAAALSVVVTLPALSDNDYVEVAICVRNGNTTITPPSGFTAISSGSGQSGTAGGDQKIVVFGHTVTSAAGEPTTATFTLSASLINGYTAVSYSPSAGATLSVDIANAQGSASSTGVTAPSVTTSTANARVTYFGAIATSPATFTAPSGLTQRKFSKTSGVGIQAADVGQATAGATGALAGTSSTAALNAAAVVALIETAAAGSDFPLIPAPPLGYQAMRPLLVF